MKLPEINTVCFVGAGTMGCFNALMAAVAGHQAVVYDVSPEARSHFPKALRAMAAMLVEQGFLPGESIPGGLARITVSHDLEAATAGADLVSESVSERLEVKRAVHHQLDVLCKPTTLITTNTSSLLVSQIEDVLDRGDRFAALHSHLGSVLIDIVGGPRTAATTIELLERYVRSIHGMPLVLRRENPGYVLNAILGPLLTMAKMLVIEGLATPEEVDRAWMRGQQVAVGPFGLMDLFGLNIIFDSWQSPRPNTAHLQDKVLAFLAPYIEGNTLGVKTGKGFYSYPRPSYQQTDFLDVPDRSTLVYQALTAVWIANALVITDNRVAPYSDIDRAWMVSFAVARGPFGALDELGIDTFMKTCADLAGIGLLPPALSEQATACLRPYIDRGHLGEKAGRGFYHYPGPAYRTADFIDRG